MKKYASMFLVGFGFLILGVIMYLLDNISVAFALQNLF